MFTKLNHTFSLLTVLALLNLAVNTSMSQSLDSPQRVQPSSAIVTAAASGEALRFSAPGNITHIRLEVFSATGEKVFDSGKRDGNLFDWRWQDEKAPAFSADSYLCVVTVQSLSGKTSRRLANLSFANQQATLKPVEVTQLTSVQAQALSATETDTPLTIIGAEQPIAATVISHDGSDGQITRTRGAFTFRFGDFFSGNDKEQMRLTEEGNLGIGTTRPKAKLDVAGMIRAREGFQFSDGSTLKINEKGVLTRTSADGTAPDSVSSTQNRLAKFTDNAGTIGDSVAIDTGTGLQLTAAPSNLIDTNVIFMNGNDRTTGMIASSTSSFSSVNGPFFAMRGNTYNAISGQRGLFAISAGSVTSATGREGSVLFNTGSDQIRMLISPTGNVGIGTTAPDSMLHVFGPVPPPTVSSGNGTNAKPVLEVVGRNGGATNDVGGLSRGGTGADVLLVAGGGGRGGFIGGSGGAMFTRSGDGANANPFGSAAAGNGGDVITQAGDGGSGAIGFNSNSGGNIRFEAGFGGNDSGNGGSISLKAGRGGSGGSNFGLGGEILIAGGPGGDPFSTVGAVRLQPNGGNVGIGVNPDFPTFKLQVLDPANTGLRVETLTAGGTIASFGPKGDFQIDASGVSGGRLVVSESGNVGIGTTAGGPFKLTLVDPSNNGLRVQTNAAGGKVASFGAKGEFQIDAPGSDGGRLRVLENGRVGIGPFSGSGPLARLHVVAPFGRALQVDSDGGDVALFGGLGDFTIVSAIENGARFIVKESGNIGIGTFVPGSKLHVNVPSSTSPISAMSIDVESFSNPGNAIASHFFRVRDVGSGSASAFLVRGNGNIGIGVDTPTAKLQVQNGDVYVGTGGNGMILKSPNGAVCRRLTIDNAGNLLSAPVTCP